MESPSNMQGMSFKKALRDGQARVVKKATEAGLASLNCQLPTGYGKTFTACCVYSALLAQGRVNRMLYIVPTTAQLDQFVTDGASDLAAADVPTPRVITDIPYIGAISLKAHRKNTSQVFATTVQALSNGRAWETVRSLMETGRWMVVVDEYHHYGIDAKWGKKVNALNTVFRLAMSATPHRTNGDGAFGAPDIVVTYLEAVKEKAVKPLLLHSYVYRVDLVDSHGGVVSYTTAQLAEEAGSENGDVIDSMVIGRQMRWSPKYVSPLVDRPISRMVRNRMITGLPLQVLVGAMSCAHADLVCGQLRAMYPELRIDWVGTGPKGRTDQENARIIRKFCPPKVEGKRRPQDIGLDVLVHVGMAGEGLDSVYVAEVVHLNKASINNSNNQENGRAARYLEGVEGFINVDSSSEYADYSGKKVMGILDGVEVSVEETPEEDNTKDSDNEWPDIPDEPKIMILDMECIHIDEGEVKRFGAEMARAAGVAEEDIAVIFKEDHPRYERWMEIATKGYRRFRSDEAEEFNAKSTVMQWEDQVNNLLSTLTRQAIRMMSSGDARIEKSLPGDLKKRINSKKGREIGYVVRDVESLKQHWYWLKNLETEMKEKGIPAWLK